MSWCTVWKGTPQDCMDHVRGAHDVPLDIKSASLEKFFPPRTVRRHIWADALKPCYSGVSTDVLLFSEIQLSLVHHYRVFRRGLPITHFARTISANYGCSCHRRQPWCSVVWCLQFRAVRSHREMFAPVMRRLSLSGRHDTAAGCGRLEFGTSPYV